MNKINVQLLFTEKEYAKLKDEADKHGLTVPLYIKGEVLQEDDFGTCYRKLISKVEDLPQGTAFNIKALFGVGWTMSKGIKLNLGKTYYNRVNEGIINNVKATGKDSSNVMWYEKL
ncbi:MAG: single-stranded DNA-binding protein [Oscillospiraceae bacterium]